MTLIALALTWWVVMCLAAALCAWLTRKPCQHTRVDPIGDGYVACTDCENIVRVR